MLQTTPTPVRAVEPHPREVLIPTATVIAYQRDNPHLILIGESKKHGKPVLPGGKIDREDLTSSSLEKSAAICVIRELREETGAAPIELRLIGVSADSDRDVRTIRAGTLAGSIVEDSVRGTPAHVEVVGRYGVPDFLFAAAVDPAAVAASDELKNLSWIDCRTAAPDLLGAGHGEFLRRYVATLQRSIASMRG